MKKTNYLLALLMLLCFNTLIYANQNVIGWNISPLINFPTNAVIGNEYTLTYTIYNNHPIVGIPIKTRINKRGGFNITNRCANVTLAPKGKPNSRCTIEIIYSPQKPEAVSLQVELNYGLNQVRLPMLSTSTNLQSAQAGRLIGYMPGYFAPASAQELSDAGYTHILVAFGVFSTTNPGQIVSAFQTVTPDLIRDIQQAGIKVLLSLGGASSTIPNTTVNFHDVLVASGSFQATFIASMESLVAQYGFDGFDFDIEFGLAPGPGGTMSNPGGDIQALANIINAVHSAHPTWLLTLAPQTANIFPTAALSEPAGNYSALVMQTAPALTWAGIQVYNSGTVYGVNGQIYDPNAVNNPDASVALAADLLENWPTPFLPYVSPLQPSQVVVGYLAPNAAGQTDGSPLVPVATIKRAIQCLRTSIAGSNSCGTYIAPRTYAGFGGVFLWQTFNDKSNHFAYAKALQPCVVGGNCS